jgi:CRISPR-associated protein Cas1
MATLYVDKQGAMVRKRDQQIIVVRHGKIEDEIPLNKVDRVVLIGRGVQISTALLAELYQRGVPLLITNQRGRNGEESHGLSRLVELRMRQMSKVTDPSWALDVARAIVVGKLANQRALLLRTGWPAAASAVPQIDRAAASLAASPDVDVVRGYEGAGAAAYFSAWRSQYEARWGFAGRAYYPPPDPLNAALSFGYTLLFHDVLTCVQTVGLDQYLGVFHAIEDGRPSLALDLMEEFRPLIVDAAIFDLLSSGALSLTHFERPASRPDAVHLNDAGRVVFIERYEAAMKQEVRVSRTEKTSMRRVLFLQTQAMARVIRDEQAAYLPFVPG